MVNTNGNLNCNIMNDTKDNTTWDELIAAIETQTYHPSETAWLIFRYLQNNYKEIGSQLSRTLLAAYMRLDIQRPSLVHSCILSIAVKVSEAYDDFRFPQFLSVWGYEDNLRDEDSMRQTGKNGRSYLSLKEKVERRLLSYRLRHHDADSLQDEGIRTVFAVKVFERQMNGKRRYFAKLVAPDGLELTADSHLFPCKPWEIQGRLFDVSLLVSKGGRPRVAEIVASVRKAEDVFPLAVGYVEGVDASHGHYHVFDSLSRHFVAEKPIQTVKAGDFVMFSPVIPAEDKFKSAVVAKVLPHAEGLERFGLLKSRVTYINRDDGYLRYSITSAIPDTPEGVIQREGFASLSAVADERARKSLAVGNDISMLLFLKRGKDGEKRNFVAEMIVGVE